MTARTFSLYVGFGENCLFSLYSIQLKYVLITQNDVRLYTIYIITYICKFTEHITVWKTLFQGLLKDCTVYGARCGANLVLWPKHRGNSSGAYTLTHSHWLIMVF